MGSRRDNKDKRQDWVLRGFRQFDAPVCVIVTYDRVLDGSDDTPFDCGAVATALVNAAWSRGLGAVINSQGIMQSPVVREHAGIADDQVIMKSIALGWPDETFRRMRSCRNGSLSRKLRYSSGSRIRRAHAQRVLSGITSGEASSPMIGSCIVTASMH